MPEMTTPRELFMHELRDIYYVEQQLVKTLPKLAREATDAELKRGFQQHLRQTERHVKNLEAAFKALGVRASGEQCPGFDGLKEEHDEFMKEEKPSPMVRDIFLTGAASRTEHYEIAAYTGLVAAARALGEKKVATLLEKNLADEKETLRKVDTIGRRLGREGAKDERRPASRRTASAGRKRTSSTRTRSSTRSATRGRATSRR